MNMWQPIETAPRNQTFLAVLDCAGEQTICTMRWPVAEAKNSRPDSKTFHVERVTHWMPLPDPPGAQAQPAPSELVEAIIDDLQSQFNTEGITENDSGDALIRLSGAIAAVEDNFAQAQPAPSVPEVTDAMIEVIESRAEQSYRRHHGSARGQQITPADALSWHIIHATREVLSAAPEVKP